MPLSPDEMAKRELNVAQANELVSKLAGSINHMMMMLALETRCVTGFDATCIKTTFETVRQAAISDADKLILKLKESLT